MRLRGFLGSLSHSGALRPPPHLTRQCQHKKGHAKGATARGSYSSATQVEPVMLPHSIADHRMSRSLHASAPESACRKPTHVAPRSGSPHLLLAQPPRGWSPRMGGHRHCQTKAAHVATQHRRSQDESLPPRPATVRQRTPPASLHVHGRPRAGAQRFAMTAKLAGQPRDGHLFARARADKAIV